MFLKKFIFFVFITSAVCSQIAYATPPIKSQHFPKILVVIFENMSYAEIKDEPTFKKLVEYTGSGLDANGHLIKLAATLPRRDNNGNGYAFFSSYYNNHSGGSAPTRSSQPNYIAMTSGSVQGINDNDTHDFDVDNLAMELNDAGVKWKVYAEDLPDPKPPLAPFPEIKPYAINANIDEQQNDLLQLQYVKQYNAAKQQYENSYAQNGFDSSSGCFTDSSYAENGEGKDDGYHRKHESLISYLNIQNKYENCKNIINAKHFVDDINNLPEVAFYIPNQINDGHNGSLPERVLHANAFLSKMMGTDPATGEPLPDAKHALFQQYLANGGLLVLTFDEPSVTGNPDMAIYNLFAGKIVASGAYPDKFGKNAPICYPAISDQTKYPQDKEGKYDPSHCNHYNLLKMIEENWGLRGLSNKNTSAGYKYAYALDKNIPNLWK